MRPEQLLQAAGLVAIEPPVRLSGGDMGEVHRIGEYVTKSHPSPPAGLFEAEARGLQRLTDAGIPVPVVRFVSDDGLVLEWLGNGVSDWRGLGELVARMHSTPQFRYGSPDEIFLGRFRLPAGESGDWASFFASHRIGPLLDATRDTLGSVADLVERAVREAPPTVEGPVLVHGDLWSGNFHFGTSGPVLIDPSCQAAERGLDLAMMELFGGFPEPFWDAYRANSPISDAVRASIPVHQLLYLLVHVHFFGTSYARGTEAAARQALASR